MLAMFACPIRTRRATPPLREDYGPAEGNRVEFDERRLTLHMYRAVRARDTEQMETAGWCCFFLFPPTWRSSRSHLNTAQAYYYD